MKDATGLYYCQNRYYDPANGRWLTRDPIGYAGGVNLYGYCGGGPVGAVDPSGLQSFESQFSSVLGIPDGGDAIAFWKTAASVGTQADTGPCPYGAMYRLYYSVFDSDTMAVLEAAIELGLLIGLAALDAAEAGPVATVKPKLVGEFDVRPLEPRKLLSGPPRSGRAPIGEDGFPIEIHHDTGGLQEMTRTDHRLGDNFAKNHPGGAGPSEVDRLSFNKFRRKYWRSPIHKGRW